MTELEKRDHEGRIVQIDAAAWGELLYVFSAAFGLAAAGCGFLIPTDVGGRVAHVASALSALLAYASILWISNTLYLVDSLVSCGCFVQNKCLCCLNPFPGVLERVVQQVRSDAERGEGVRVL